MSLYPSFQTHEILCVEHHTTYLYAELIQVVEPRQLCWVRPLVLLIAPHPSTHDNLATAQESMIYNLQGGADLLLPSNLFRAALDPELLPLLTQLADPKHCGDSDRLAHQQLQSFVWQIWQTHPEKFPA